jgi:hypothetical protein
MYPRCYLRTRFYAAQILLGLEYLHNHHIVYLEYVGIHTVSNPRTSSSTGTATSGSAISDYPLRITPKRISFR